MNESPSHSPTSRSRARWIPALAVFLLSGFVFAMGGDQGRLHHDDAIFFYGGQEMVRGTPIYVGIFDHKGPLGQMVCALGIWIAQIVGSDGLLTTRLLFLAIAAATATTVFGLADELFRSRKQAFLTSAAFVSFWGYGVFAYSGTRPKMLVTLFVALALLAGTRRKWFWSGMAATLAAFTWQPTGIFFIAALVLAWFHSSERTERTRAILRLIGGALVPSLAMLVYFASVGALGEFIDGCFLFNLNYLENPGTLRMQLSAMMKILIYSGMGVPTLFGLLVIFALYPWRIAKVGFPGILRDRFGFLLLTYPFPLLWSLHDFQQYPDFFIFLPYVAIGLGWIMMRAAQGLAEQISGSERTRTTLVLLPGIVLLAFSCGAYRIHRNAKLLGQREHARAFVEEFGDAKIAAIGFPDALVLLERTNVTPYGFIMRGIARYIDETYPGGFVGWLTSISASEPDVLFIDSDYPRRLGDLAGEWESWLEGYEPYPKTFGDWTLWVPRRE